MKPYILLFFILFTSSLAFSQSLSVQSTQPDEMGVCQSDTFFFIVSNTSNPPVALSNLELTLSLPLSLEYVVGSSSSNLQELNTSTPSQPVFSLPNIAPFASDTFSLIISAPCAATAQLNAGVLFQNILDFTYTGGNTSYTTPPYDVETPLLVFTNFSPIVLNGQVGDTLSRSISIRNTRLGPLSEFVLTATHSGSLNILGFGAGTPQTVGADSFQVVFDALDFVNVGDGDGLLEQGEELVLTEQLVIAACENAQATYDASWGCNGEICQTITENAIVQVDAQNFAPDVQIVAVAEMDSCFCGQDPIPQQLIVSNNGNAPAYNLLLEVEDAYTISGIDAGSFVLFDGGSLSPVTPAFSSNVSQASLIACLGPTGLKESASILVDTLLPGETVFLFWDMYFCSGACSNTFSGWSYNYSYLKDCPVGSSVSTGGPPVNLQSITHSLSPSSAVVPDSINQQLSYNIQHPLLNSVSGQMNVSMSIPYPLSYIPNPSDFLLNNSQAPSSISIDTTNQSFNLSYDLPLIANNPSFSFEISTSCDSNQTVLIPPISLNTSLSISSNCPANCGISLCPVNSYINPACPGTPGIPDTLPQGICIQDYGVQRINFGQADNDDDGVMDAIDSLDMNAIRFDRAITGDTLEETLLLVVEDSMLRNFPIGFIETTIEELSGANTDFASPSGISCIGAQVIIYDVSDSVTYTCSNVGFTGVGNNVELKWTFDISPASLSNNGCGNIPANWQFEDGDSLRFTSQYRVLHNSGDGTYRNWNAGGKIQDIVFRPFAYLADSAGQSLELGCFLGGRLIEISGYWFWNTRSASDLIACDFGSWWTSINLALAERNFFPFEYRSFADLIRIEEDLPNSYQISGNFITIGPAFFSFPPLVPINPSSTSGNSNIFDNFSIAMPDEEFKVAFYELLTPPCDAPSGQIFQDGEIRFLYEAPSLNLSGIQTETGPREAIIRSPGLEINVPLPITSSQDSLLEWDISLTNIPEYLFTFLLTGDAKNVWIAPTAPNIGNYQLYEMPANTPISQNNGIFQLGNIPADSTQSYRLTAIDYGCVDEQIVLNYGWNCTPYTDTATTACYAETEALFNSPILPEMELNIISPAGPFDLCTPIPPYELEIFNAEIGTAYEIILQAELPPGLTIVPSSSELAYPDTASTFASISDPTDLGNGLYEWQISVEDDSLDTRGLLGVLDVPQNRMIVRFQLESNCDIQPGAVPIFRVLHETHCGTIGNVLAKAADPVQINGVNIPYLMDIALQNDSLVTCSDSLRIPLQLVNTTTGFTMIGDSVQVDLPAGMNYAGGVIAGINAPITNAVLTNAGQRVSWELPDSLGLGDTIRFSFLVDGLSMIDCQEQQIEVQSISVSPAFCFALGQSCAITVITGSDNDSIRIDKADLSIGDFGLDAYALSGADSVVYSLEIENNGNFDSEDSLVVSLYVDADQSQDVSVGDVLLENDTLVSTLVGGSSQVFSGTWQTDSSLCSLMAVLNPSGNCLCAEAVAFPTIPIAYETGQTAMGCAGDTIQFSIPSEANTNYQWSPTLGLSCDSCASTSIILQNSSDSLQQNDYLLQSTDAFGCQVRYSFATEVRPSPAIQTADTSICQGDSIRLQATFGSSYQWTGPNFSSSVSNPWVLPTSASTYYASLTNFFGCSRTDSIQIGLNALPSLSTSDATFCIGNSTILSASFDPTYSYQWQPSASLSNPSIHNPTAFPNSTTLYTLTATDANGCQNQDSLVVTVTPNISVNLGPDTLLNAMPILDAGNAGCSYIWSTGETSQTITPAFSGLYFVTVNCPGCQATDTIQLREASLFEELLWLKGDPVGDAIWLNWEVNSEENTVAYRVEKQLANGFVELGRQEAVEANALRYVFVDEVPETGLNLYRVGREDEMGGTKYSDVIRVWFEGGNALTVYPNPAHAALNVRFRAEGAAHLRLINELGELAKQQELSGASGELSLDVSELSRGVYALLLVIDGNVEEVQKVILR